MSYKFEEGKDAIIDAVVNLSPHQKGTVQFDVFEQFTRQFFSTISLEVLQELTISDLYALSVNFLLLMHKRSEKEIKIKIYNPEFEHHGWQTTHTVLEVISDDMPFMVDSIRMVLNRMQISTHLSIHMGGLRVERNQQDEMVHILPRHARPSNHIMLEAPILFEIDRQTNPKILKELYAELERVLEDTRAVFEDWMPMRKEVRVLIDELATPPQQLDADEVEETRAFLSWIEDHHFTFLGIRDYELVQKGKETILQALPHTSLGILKKEQSHTRPRNIAALAPEARELILSSHILVMSKTNSEATVHRNAHIDYIGVKRFDSNGNVVGERRIVGLFTAAAYNTNPKYIPFLRHKVEHLLKNSGLNPQGHSGKILLNIIDTLPRDDLIQASEDDLLEIVMGIYYMQERRRIHLFSRVDIYRRFVSCLVYVPKDIFSTELRRAMQDILNKSLHATSITFSTLFTESTLARIHFLVRINPEEDIQYDFKEIEQQLIEVGRSWKDDFQSILIEELGEEPGTQIFQKYKHAFQTAYFANFTPRMALFDIQHIEKLSEANPLEMNFYQPLEDDSDHFRLKIYQHDNTIPLSDVLPILENMGLRAITERPYVLTLADGKETWINDFSLQYISSDVINLDETRDLFQNAFMQIWFGAVENDGFNKLVLAAGLDWRQIIVIRAYAKYFKQIGFTFSQDYIETALDNNKLIARKIVELFEIRFGLTQLADAENKFKLLVDVILKDLDDVVNLDEDKIIRQYVHGITATTRTNYYQTDKMGKPKEYLSLKLNTSLIPGVPRPLPMFEIFVYSPTLEGVHLRCGHVARGGLRWSDRKEDFRTEILGLMKAQQVKNAVIVPCGAKGGFVPKQLPVDGSREDIQLEGIRCYRLFIRGLLDITDNYHNGLICKPVSVICYDEDDPYLVVAADKGTATFSDIANEISLEYGFWLGDAFASGGSVGYDHKKMGITAKGAWESVKRHFYELGFCMETSNFTVVGIGDMAGDVFGNGMLLSEHIQLVAAFNHQHIFIDPNPCAEKSFKERERLFNLPRSSWADYNPKLISSGGGVFNRHAKSITLTPEMMARFDIEKTAIEPNELIRLILKARVDLVWSAGIGTFVKSENESNNDVGDRTNDIIRVNGSELRCRVVGEGGNLGFTQLGRIEYALTGGRIYTDFIDNSAGVSCSDKEVNIKILLNRVVEDGNLTEKQRNALLSEMTGEVAQLVLRENYLQPRSISLTEFQALHLVELHLRYMNELERMGKLDRELEFLPTDKNLGESKLIGFGLNNPSISVLLCYSKILLKEMILASDLPEEAFLKSFLLSAFPKPLQKKYSTEMEQHPLRREIIATQLSNIIVDEMGFSFVYRIQDETGASISAIVRAYMIARKVMKIEAIQALIESLDSQIDAKHQHEILMTYVRLLRRVTRWFLRNNRTAIDMSDAVRIYSLGVEELGASLPSILSRGNREQYDTDLAGYQKKKIPSVLAHELTITRDLFSAMDIIEVATILNVSIPEIAKVYYGLGEYLDLNWIREQVIAHQTENHWEALSREALRDDLDWQQRLLTEAVVQLEGDGGELMIRFAKWSKNYETLIERWLTVLANLKASQVLNYTMYFVAIRELLNLTQTTLQGCVVKAKEIK